jgi:hypothetical protein
MASTDYSVVINGVYHRYFPKDNGGGESASYEDGDLFVQCNISVRSDGIECRIWRNKRVTQYWCEEPREGKFLPPEIVQMLREGVFTRRFVEGR